MVNLSLRRLLHRRLNRFAKTPLEPAPFKGLPTRCQENAFRLRDTLRYRRVQALEHHKC